MLHARCNKNIHKQGLAKLEIPNTVNEVYLKQKL